MTTTDRRSELDTKIMALIATLARMTKDGEEISDGSETYEFDMQHDDAVNSLHYAIDAAREILPMLATAQGKYELLDVPAGQYTNIPPGFEVTRVHLFPDSYVDGCSDEDCQQRHHWGVYERVADGRAQWLADYDSEYDALVELARRRAK